MLESIKKEIRSFNLRKLFKFNAIPQEANQPAVKEEMPTGNSYFGGYEMGCFSNENYRPREIRGFHRGG